MVDYKFCFMVCRHLRQCPFSRGWSDVKFRQIVLMGWSSDENQGSSQLHCHDPWLVCEVTLGFCFKGDHLTYALCLLYPSFEVPTIGHKPKIGAPTIRFACKYEHDGHFSNDTRSPWPLHIKNSQWWKNRPVQFRFTVCSTDQLSMWMQEGCKVYMDSNLTSNGSCFMVTWIIFKNHLLEVGLTQNQETMTLWTLTTVGLFYFIMCEDLHE